VKPLSDFVREIFRHPWRTLADTFIGFSAIFTIARAITFFLPTTKIEGALPFAAAVVVGFAYALVKAWRPPRVEISLPNCNTVIEVIFGDLFAQDGIRAIAVNEFFDSELGNPVSPVSVHGLFIKRVFGGRPDSFDKQVEEELKNIVGLEVIRAEGKSTCYPIGTSVLITANADRYIAFAFARTDPATCKASSDVATMWLALQELWKRARVECNGHPLNLPLVGSGLAAVGLPARVILDLIILSIIVETKLKHVTPRIRVVLFGDRFGFPDLRDVVKNWNQ
jgi:hypothetical protein